VFAVKNLEVLNVAGNAITSVPGSIGKLTMLMNLQLDGRSIVEGCD